MDENYAYVVPVRPSDNLMVQVFQKGYFAIHIFWIAKNYALNYKNLNFTVLYMNTYGLF